MSYKVAAQASPSADGVFASVKPGSTNQVSVHSCVAVMNDTGTAGARRYRFGRFTGGVTPTAITPEKNNSRSAASDSTGASIWSTTPSISGNPLVIATVLIDAGGTWAQVRRWTPPSARYLPTEMPSGSIFGIDQASSSGIVISGTIGFEEGCERPRRRFRGVRNIRNGPFLVAQTVLNGLNGVATRPLNGASSHSQIAHVQDQDWLTTVAGPQWNINLFGGGGSPPPADDYQFLMTMGVGS